MSTPSWVFGGILLVFLMAIVAWQMTRSDTARPPDETATNIIGLICAITAGLFAFFMTGDVVVKIAPTAPQAQGLGIQATGGVGLFVFVMWWWKMRNKSTP